jgi:hypothetical protein
LYISTLSVLIVGVADDVVEPTLAVHRLFVKVVVDDAVTGVVQVIAEEPPPALVSTSPDVPAVVGQFQL